MRPDLQTKANVYETSLGTADHYDAEESIMKTSLLAGRVLFAFSDGILPGCVDGAAPLGWTICVYGRAYTWLLSLD